MRLSRDCGILRAEFCVPRLRDHALVRPLITGQA
ncbi:hypothetical protein HNQ64_002970 [Prosthecobacter dejongeii]|uniref:Uncharacterized protein n=1 Tax=Prosthecobacter dejongeii TaxID=48465 RepID=A0A7W7YME2_9BACT|nr:hypothetical protein [Prosthecobacter dejongeii]